MANSTINFRRNVLRYYDLVVQFDGLSPKQVRQPSDGTAETFSQWRKRVLGDEVSNIRIFRPVEVSGATRMQTLANEGTDLKALVRAVSVRDKERAKEQIEAAKEELLTAKKKVQRSAQKKVANAIAEKETEVQQVRERVYKREEQVPFEILEEILQRSDLDAATQEFLKRLVEKARKDRFPLDAVLRGLVDQHVLAVAASKEKNDV